MIYLGGYSSQAGQGLGVVALPEDVLAVGSTAGSPDDPTFLAVGPGGRPCTSPMSWSTGW